MTADRFAGFSIGEQQHILIGLLAAKDRGLTHSPIIDRLIEESSQALDIAVKTWPEVDSDDEVTG